MLNTIKSVVKKPIRHVKMRWLRSRLEPASRHWGTERGKAIDRVYLEHFLEQHKDDIRGEVMEIGGRYYTNTFGTDVKKSVSYDIVDGEDVDIVGDLATGVGLRDNQFDCVLVLQTLMLIHDIQGACDTIKRILKPGGVAIVTVNFLAPNCENPAHHQWQWNISPNAARKLFFDRFEESNTSVNSYGNYLTASCLLAGLSDRDVSLEYWKHEPGYEVLVGVRAKK